MKDLILFSIDKNHFALELEKIKRIVQASPTTPVAGNATEIEGIFTFEDNVLNVLDFRTMIGIETFDTRYKTLFSSFREDHDTLVELLVNSLENDIPFEAPLSHHECALGQWLNSFQPYDEHITKTLNELSTVDTTFHTQAADALSSAKQSSSAALEMVKSSLLPLKERQNELLNKLEENRHFIANSMQKFLIIDAAKSFAVRIDEVDDIIAISEEDIQSSESFEEDDSLVKIDGIFEYKEKLVNLIGTVKMPVSKD